jgi:hypothetical protein
MADFPPRRRSSGPEWLGRLTARMTGTVKALVLVYLVSYLFYVLTPNVRDFVDLHVALGPQLFMGELWQPLTSLLAPVHFFSFLFPFVGLWYVGGVIEGGARPKKKYMN